MNSINEIIISMCLMIMMISSKLNYCILLVIFATTKIISSKLDFTNVKYLLWFEIFFSVLTFLEFYSLANIQNIDYKYIERSSIIIFIQLFLLIIAFLHIDRLIIKILFLFSIATYLFVQNIED